MVIYLMEVQCSWTERVSSIQRRSTYKTRSVRRSERCNRSYTNSNTEKGLSGAWVVHENTLLGILVAVYDRDACAHMLPIHKVFSDIRTAMLLSGDISAIETSLPKP
jgi:hypothetical protein